MREYFMGKSVIVTGAAQGIGFKIVQELLDKGARVVINDISPEFLQRAKNKLANDENLRMLAGDASETATIKEMVELAVSEFGKLDFAVANAGLTEMGEFLNFPEHKLNKMLKLNLAGSFILAQTAAHQMISQGNGGRILLMSSVTGVQAHQYTEGYGMTKAALKMLAKDLGVSLAPHGITVNCVAPGATLTERTLSEKGYAQSWSKVIPTGRASTVDDIANACIFFLGPGSAQITGQTLIVDGGWSSTSPLPGELYK
jgi:3-oxoacyl-[acyl-carrier protein] reductase